MAEQDESKKIFEQIKHDHEDITDLVVGLYEEGKGIQEIKNGDFSSDDWSTVTYFKLSGNVLWERPSPGDKTNDAKTDPAEEKEEANENQDEPRAKLSANAAAFTPKSGTFFYSSPAPYIIPGGPVMDSMGRYINPQYAPRYGAPIPRKRKMRPSYLERDLFFKDQGMYRTASILPIAFKRADGKNREEAFLLIGGQPLQRRKDNRLYLNLIGGRKYEDDRDAEYTAVRSFIQETDESLFPKGFEALMYHKLRLNKNRKVAWSQKYKHAVFLYFLNDLQEKQVFLGKHFNSRHKHKDKSHDFPQRFYAHHKGEKEGRGIRELYWVRLSVVLSILESADNEAQDAPAEDTDAADGQGNRKTKGRDTYKGVKVPIYDRASKSKKSLEMLTSMHSILREWSLRQFLSYVASPKGVAAIHGASHATFSSSSGGPTPANPKQTIDSDYLSAAKRGGTKVKGNSGAKKQKQVVNRKYKLVVVHEKEDGNEFLVEKKEDGSAGLFEKEYSGIAGGKNGALLSKSEIMFLKDFVDMSKEDVKYKVFIDNNFKWESDGESVCLGYLKVDMHKNKVEKKKGGPEETKENTSETPEKEEAEKGAQAEDKPSEEKPAEEKSTESKAADTAEESSEETPSEDSKQDADTPKEEEQSEEQEEQMESTTKVQLPYEWRTCADEEDAFFKQVLQQVDQYKSQKGSDGDSRKKTWRGKGRKFKRYGGREMKKNDKKRK